MELGGGGWSCLELGGGGWSKVEVSARFSNTRLYSHTKAFKFPCSYDRFFLLLDFFLEVFKEFFICSNMN